MKFITIGASFILVLLVYLVSSWGEPTPSIQDQTGRLVFDGWNEIVARYKTERSSDRDNQLWIYVNGRIVRKLPFQNWDQHRSESLLLLPGTYKVEVLMLSDAHWLSNYHIDRPYRDGIQSAANLHGILWAETVEVRSGATVLNQLAKQLTDNKGRTINDYRELAVDWKHSSVEEEDIKKLYLYTCSIDLQRHVCDEGSEHYGEAAMLFPRLLREGVRRIPDDPIFDANAVAAEKLRKSLEKRIRALQESPVLRTLLETALLLQQQPPTSPRIRVPFADGIGGPREVDAGLVRQLFYWVEYESTGGPRIANAMSDDPKIASMLKQYDEWYETQHHRIEHLIFEMANQLERAGQ